MVAHRSRAVGGALQGEIVDDDRLLVGGEVHVQLDAVGALLEGQLEGRDGVLGRVGRGASVADHEGARGRSGHCRSQTGRGTIGPCARP